MFREEVWNNTILIFDPTPAYPVQDELGGRQNYK